MPDGRSPHSGNRSRWRAKDFLEKVPEKQDYMATSCCPAWSVMAKKEFPGRLVRYEDGAVTIEMRGREVTFDKAEVALVRLRVEF